MNEKERARNLRERAEEGERSRELVEAAYSMKEATTYAAQRNASTALYIILADEPGLFVRDYDSFFDDLLQSDPPDQTVTTFSFIAESPPSECRQYIEELLQLLRQESSRTQLLAAVTLRELAGEHPTELQRAECAFRALLDHSNPQLRVEACFGLVSIDAINLVDEIEGLRQDPNPQVQNIAEWAIEELESKTQSERWERQHLLDRQARGFEKLIADLWGELGYQTSLTEPGPDGGYDVRARSGNETILIQAKRWSGTKVSAPKIKQMYGTVNQHDADHGMIVTSYYYTSPAKEVADDLGIELINGDELCDRLTEQGFVPPNSAGST